MSSKLISENPLLYIETVMVVALAGGVKFFVEPRLLGTPSPAETIAIPCGVYAVMWLIASIFTSLVVTAAVGSFDALVNLIVNAPLVIGSTIVILRVSERVSAHYLLNGVTRVFLTLRAMLSIVWIPWFIFILDNPRVTPEIDIFDELADLPDVVRTLLFISLPLTIQIFAFRGTTIARIGFTNGFLATVAFLSTLAAVVADLLEAITVSGGGDIVSATIVLSGAGFVAVPPVQAWKSGISFAGSTAAGGALFVSVLSSGLIPATSRNLIQYAILFAGVGTIQWVRSKTRDDQTIIGTASFTAVTLTTRIAYEILDMIGSFNVVTSALVGCLALGALYVSFVSLAPPRLAIASDASATTGVDGGA